MRQLGVSVAHMRPKKNKCDPKVEKNAGKRVRCKLPQARYGFVPASDPGRSLLS
jgi:hypothetical protein